MGRRWRKAENEERRKMVRTETHAVMDGNDSVPDGAVCCDGS